MSLTNRAIVALCLMVGFYLLALSVAAGLVWIAYADWAYRDRLDRIEIACVIAAVMILWSILPRFDRFEPPGLRITKEQEPRLFAEISGIAWATGQTVPHEVYLTPEVNAGVAQRGGIAGLGSRRVMVLGLPLMALLTVSQFRAVLAHEFGHYHAGDTKLGPWIYRTRATIIRTVKTLANHRSFLAYLSYLFKWYAEMFLRITLAISRAQEYAADQLAAQFAGSKALIEGLKQLHRGDAAWNSYLQTEVGPVISAGFLPPLSAGLAYFIAGPQMSGPVEASLERELAEGKAEVFDSHPSLRERIAALQNAPSGVLEDSRRAIELVNNLQLAETSFLRSDVADRKLQPVAWDHVLEKVWDPNWRTQVHEQRQALQGTHVADLAQLLASGELGRKLTGPPGVWLTNEQRADMARGIASVALALALLRAGWTFHTLPGEAYCEKDGRRLEPFKLVSQLVTDKSAQEKWHDLCKDYGIADLVLSPETAEQASAT